MNHPWDFVNAAYVVSSVGLVALAASVLWSLRTWSKRAQELERGG